MTDNCIEIFPINFHPKMKRVPLYVKDNTGYENSDNGFRILPNTECSFDSVLNSFFEREIFLATGAKKARLKLNLTGECIISLIHRSETGVQRVVWTKKTPGSSIVSGRLVPQSIIAQKEEFLCQDEPDAVEAIFDFDIGDTNLKFGRWFFSVRSFGAPVTLRSGAWCIFCEQRPDIKLAFVICTFRREEAVRRNVQQILDISTENCLDIEVIVVDNARSVRPYLPDDSRIRLIEQRNVGGAGGFGRGLHESLSCDKYTHTVFMDDDAEIDSVSIVRLVGFLKFSSGQHFIGGMQFDVYDQTRVADPGTYWMPDRFERPSARIPPSDMSYGNGCDELASSSRLNFNGWWLFGGANELFKKFGMPLPCFVHLDDVDFGVRVYLQGGSTITSPSICVWHEPYYAKTEGWFAYYNIRNELIRFSAHMPMLLRHRRGPQATEYLIQKFARRRKREIRRQLVSRFNNFCHTYQYGSALIMCAAIEDFLGGPSILRDFDAEMLHSKIMAMYGDLNKNMQRVSSLPIGSLPVSPEKPTWFRKAVSRVLKSGHFMGIGRLNRHSRRIIMIKDRNSIGRHSMQLGLSWSYPDPNASGYFVYHYDFESYKKLKDRFAKAIRLFDELFVEKSKTWGDDYHELCSAENWQKLVKTFGYTNGSHG